MKIQMIVGLTGVILNLFMMALCLYRNLSIEAIAGWLLAAIWAFHYSMK